MSDNLKLLNSNEHLPERTIERLSEYRRTLFRLTEEGRTHIYSHELASMHGITAVQVRRDLMLIGFTTDSKKGYDVEILAAFIGEILDSPHMMNVAIIGMGNLAQAITHYFNGKRSRLHITASFDIAEKKVGSRVAGIECYHIDDFADVVAAQKIKVVILTLPSAAATELVEPITRSGIRGVLNFTSTPLSFPSSVYVEDYDIITLLEKVAYFAKEE